MDSLGNLLAVLGIALGAPLVLGFARRVPIPSSVLEIVTGIIVGPSVLEWVEVDAAVRVLALIGLAFLLFLSGLEVDLSMLRGRRLRLAGTGWLWTLVLAVVVCELLNLAGLLDAPIFVAIALSATAIGIVAPALRDAGASSSETGQLVLANAGIAGVGTIVLLSLFYSRDATGTGSRVFLLCAFVALVAAAGVVVGRIERSMRLGALFARLQDTSAQIRIRAAMLLLVGLAVLAERLGLEVVLGAFVAGAILKAVDRDAEVAHPHTMIKLDGIGFGFLVPVFFVSVGLRFDADALFGSGAAVARVPVFLAALLVVRGVPALAYRSLVGPANARAAGLLQATNLTFIVATAQIGMSLGTIDAPTGAGLVAAGLLSAVVFPPAALAILRASPEAVPAAE